MKSLRLMSATFLFFVLLPFASAQKALKPLVWKPGESFVYLIHLKIDRDIKALSALSLPNSPAQENFDAQGLLHVTVLDAASQPSASGARLRTWFQPRASELSQLEKLEKSRREESAQAPAQSKSVECVLQPDGQISAIEGLDQLAAEQQEAWREWATQFAGAFLVAQARRKPGEKWSSEEPETSPAPIDGLRWQRKSQYVRDEQCASVELDAAGNALRAKSSDICAVILTDAALQQKSSPQDATPEDYKLRGLRTRGTAKGTNETIVYISRKTGLLVRATQEAKQEMDVSIVQATGGNQVHYALNASARSSVELVTTLPPDTKPARKE